MLIKTFVKHYFIILLYRFVVGNQIDDLLILITKETYNAINYEFPVNNSEFWGNSTDDNIYGYGRYDFIIIGSGSSGSVIANRLSEISNWNILLVEAGGEEDNFTDIPAMAPLSTLSKRNWGYFTTTQNNSCLGMINKQCFYPRGKIIGGSSSVNGLMYVRGNKWDYNIWNYLGGNNTEWSYEKVLPYFQKSENSLINGDVGYHGFNGPFKVDYIKPKLNLLNTFVEANEQLGQNYLDYNGREQIGVSRLQSNLNFGKRISGGRAFIDPARKRKNLKISINSLVTKIIINKKRKFVYGIKFIKNGKTYRASVRKEVILSAGAINSPQILMLSGIGPKNELNRLGIEAIKHLSTVGKNFKDHIAYSLMFRANSTGVNSTSNNIYELLQDYLNGYGRLTNAASVIGVSFINTLNVSEQRPNIQYSLVPPIESSDATITQRIYNYNDTVLQDYLDSMNSTTDFQITVILLHPKSTGEITLKSKSPLDYPNINVNHFSDNENEDIETLYQGIKFILNLTETEAFKKINATLIMPNNLCNDKEIDSKEYWYCFIRTMAISAYHAMGTTSMGKNEINSVVNSRLKVHGIKGLRIADCGIMPETPSGNLNAPAIMIGEKVSDFIKKDHHVIYENCNNYCI